MVPFADAHAKSVGQVVLRWRRGPGTKPRDSATTVRWRPTWRPTRPGTGQATQRIHRLPMQKLLTMCPVHGKPGSLACVRPACPCRARGRPWARPVCRSPPFSLVSAGKAAHYRTVSLALILLIPYALVSVGMCIGAGQSV